MASGALLSLGPAATRVGAPARCARWDPNVSNAAGVSHEDGTFTYWHSVGRSVRMQLFSFEQSEAASPSQGQANVQPAALNIPWSLWSFIPGCRGQLIICLRQSSTLITTRIALQELPPIDGEPGSRFPPVVTSSTVQEVTGLQNSTAITALGISSCGSFGALGSLDGTVSFWSIAPNVDPALAPAHSSPSVHQSVHKAPVTAVGLLTGELQDAGVQTALCASGAADQSVFIFDLHAQTRLMSLLTPAGAPVSALSLSLIPPYGIAAPADDPGEPTVFVLLGASDGGVQAWSLRRGHDAQLRSTWLHSQKAPILALALSEDGCSVLSVAETGPHDLEPFSAISPSWVVPGSEPLSGELEVHSVRDWSLQKRRRIMSRDIQENGLRASTGDVDPIVSADFHSRTESSCIVDGFPRLLLSRCSGIIHRWDVSETTRKSDGMELLTPIAGRMMDDPSTDPHQSPSLSAPSCMSYVSCPPSQSSDAPTAPSPNTEYLDSPRVLPDPYNRMDTANSMPNGHSKSIGGIDPGPCGTSGGSIVRASSVRQTEPRPRPAPMRPTPPPPTSIDYKPVTTVEVERIPPRPRSPPPAPQHYDNPERVRALLAPPPVAGPPASRLSEPSALSSEMLRRRHEEDQAAFAEHEQAVLRSEARQQALREATLALEAPLEQATRYENLIPIEAEIVTQPRPIVRRREPRWLAAQALQPNVLELFTPDREVEMVDTTCNVAKPTRLMKLDGTPADDEDLRPKFETDVGWPYGVWEKLPLGSQHPFTFCEE